MAKLYEETGSSNGLYVQEYSIKDVISNSLVSQFPKDIDFIFVLETQIGEDNRTIERKHYVSGNLFKDKSIPPNLTDLLYACGIDEEVNKELIIEQFANSNLSQELKNFFIGKRIKLLSFVSGTYNSGGLEKASYKQWTGIQGLRNRINPFSLLSPNDKIIEAFKKQLNTSYPPAYTPEVLAELEEKSQLESQMENEEDMI